MINIFLFYIQQFFCTTVSELIDKDNTNLDISLGKKIIHKNWVIEDEKDR